ncbi:signal peptidase II [Allocatelliglobosispora scoriae]|uniref:Lipoprotein signal peptidase n=2 Tax=Allocatelliglobosispora scoriae TaxID=643052 RepID=A0A841BNV4_9ACTN|nr:signal peptidase II [Allocatelliglobosispora scoriae]MBB5869355.1 signal peptidase II [Allocatelliglobosispora scoriae]
METKGSQTVIEAEPVSAPLHGGQGKRRRAVATLVTVALAAIGLDLLTKQLVIAHLEGGEPVKWLGGAVYLSVTRNGGAAFSLGKDYTFIFPVIAFCVLAWIGWNARKLASPAWGVALGLVAGGACGNLLDRIFRWPSPFNGHVVDFISLFGPYGEVFAVFNVADMSLTFGVILAIYLELTGRQRDGSRLRRDDKPAGEVPA